MNKTKNFIDECISVRNDFAKVARKYSVEKNLQLRTEIDTLLIMYDQLIERVRMSDSGCNKCHGLTMVAGVNGLFKPCECQSKK